MTLWFCFIFVYRHGFLHIVQGWKIQAKADYLFFQIIKLDKETLENNFQPGTDNIMINIWYRSRSFMNPFPWSSLLCLYLLWVCFEKAKSNEILTFVRNWILRLFEWKVRYYASIKHKKIFISDNSTLKYFLRIQGWKTLPFHREVRCYFLSEWLP